MFAEERGLSEFYTLTPVQADAILRMTLGQLVNLEQEKLTDEHRKLLAGDRASTRRILSDRQNILDIIRDDCRELKRKHGDARRTEISGEEVGELNLEDLITEETMVVSISGNGYIKRTPASVYRAQRRGGKGLTGAKTEEEDPIQHLFVASTHAYLLFFTNKGKVYWRKVYDLPQLARDARGRAVVNLLNLGEDEQITDCRAVRDFDHPDHFLVMATARGLVKKTPLERPTAGRCGAASSPSSSARATPWSTWSWPSRATNCCWPPPTAWRSASSSPTPAPMGRNSSGVKGIRLVGDDSVVGMVVADPASTLLTACANGYGKRTPFGPNIEAGPDQELPAGDEADDDGDRQRRDRRSRRKGRRRRSLQCPRKPKSPKPTKRPKTETRSAVTARRAAAARGCATSRPPSATARWSASWPSPTRTNC